MRLLLDTHAFLWFVLNDPQLSGKAQALMVDPNNELLFSPASYWEIAIKASKGKYQIPGNFEDFMNQEISNNNLAILPISVKHVSILATLPFHHGDPFDRLLIAQAIIEQIPIISTDKDFDSYPVTRIW